jgi:hypothetical protein
MAKFQPLFIPLLRTIKTTMDSDDESLDPWADTVSEPLNDIAYYYAYT